MVSQLKFKIIIDSCVEIAMATESIGATLKICYSESVYEYIIEKVEE
jgi:hypothetical protein